MRVISSRQNPIVRAFRALADAPDPSGARLLLDGAHLVREARRAGLAIEVAAVASSRVDSDTQEGRLARELAREGVDTVSASDSVFAALSPVRSPSGIAAVVRRTPATIESICSARDPLIVAVIDVQDPGNVGAIVRVAEAGGATGILVCGASASPFSWKAVRGSMGSTLRLPTVGSVPMGSAFASMKSAGIRTVAAVARDGHDPDALDWTGSIAVVLGGEGPGLSQEAISACDDRVTIPMADPVESLNVAAAAAILVYAARRQRLPRLH
jgi:TrmH family RNA methyltransferase